MGRLKAGLRTAGLRTEIPPVGGRRDSLVHGGRLGECCYLPASGDLAGKEDPVMGMTTYQYDPTGQFDPADEAVGAAYLVTVELHWRLIHAPAAGLMPRGTKHKPKCRHCRKIIRDVCFWYFDKHAYCRACGDEHIAPHCLCGCKGADCPVCQAKRALRKTPGKRTGKTQSKRSRKAPAQPALGVPDLKARLVDLLEKHRADFEQKFGHMTVNPLTGKPGYIPPDQYPKGVTEEDLVAFRSRTGVDLPEDVKAWLRITNGAPGFFGIGWAQRGCNMEDLWQLWPEMRAKGWIPIGSDEFGNFFVRVVPEPGGRGGVFHVEATSMDRLVYVAASDALHYALFHLEHLEAYRLRRTSGWPQDKEHVLSQDPEMAHVEGAPFYWDLMRDSKRRRR